MYTIACIECIYFGQVYDFIVKENRLSTMCLQLITEGTVSSKFEKFL